MNTQLKVINQLLEKMKEQKILNSFTIRGDMANMIHAGQIYRPFHSLELSSPDLAFHFFKIGNIATELDILHQAYVKALNTMSYDFIIADNGKKQILPVVFRAESVNDAYNRNLPISFNYKKPVNVKVESIEEIIAKKLLNMGVAIEDYANGITFNKSDNYTDLYDLAVLLKQPHNEVAVLKMIETVSKNPNISYGSVWAPFNLFDDLFIKMHSGSYNNTFRKEVEEYTNKPALTLEEIVMQSQKGFDMMATYCHNANAKIYTK